MRAYLESILTACSYEAEDAAYLLQAYDRILENDAAANSFAEAISEYETNDPADHVRILSLADEAAMYADLHEYTTELLVYLCLTRELKRRYNAKGMEERIFYDTILDLRYKLEECKAVKGVCGSFVAFWFGDFFEMKRFALGRLQFEIVPFEEDSYQNGERQLNRGDSVINVHIPRTGTSLDAQACASAYAKAAEFFAPQIQGDTAFVCYSWLLYPQNESILGEKSNIVRFMKEYTILRSGISKDRADLWRLFDTDEQHPDRLPTDTTARKNYVRHLREGGKLGWGYGVFFYDIS